MISGSHHPGPAGCDEQVRSDGEEMLGRTIAIAVRTDTPIYASEDVLAEAGQVIEEHPSDGGSENDPDELLDEFKQFLDGVNPDDF